MTEQTVQQHQPLHQSGNNGQRIGIQGNLVEPHNLSCAAPVKAHQRKAKEIQKRLRQMPLVHGRQLRNIMSQPLQDFTARDIGHRTINHSHHYKYQWKEIIQHLQSLRNIFTGLGQSLLTHAHSLVKLQSGINRRLQGIHLLRQRIHPHNEKPQPHGCHHSCK